MENSYLNRCNPLLSGKECVLSRMHEYIRLGNAEIISYILNKNDNLYIRTIVLFVFLRNSCKPDMVLVYIFVE